MPNNQSIFIKNNAPRTVEVTPGSLDAKGKNNIVKAGEGTAIHHPAGEVIQHDFKTLLQLDGNGSHQAQEECVAQDHSFSSTVKIGNDSRSSEVKKSNVFENKNDTDPLRLINTQELNSEKLKPGSKAPRIEEQNLQKLDNPVIREDRAFMDTPKQSPHTEVICQGEKVDNSAHVDEILNSSSPVSVERHNGSGENLQAIDQDPEQSNAQRFTHHDQAENKVSIGPNAMVKNDQHLGSDDRLDNSQRLSSQASLGNKILLESSRDDIDKQTIDFQKVENHSIEIENPSLTSSRATVPQDIILDHKVLLHKEVPDSNRYPSSLQPTLEQHVSHGKGDRGLQRQALNTEQKKPEDDRMAKKKKAAEFHSRVEAIRNSVKAVNERIDKIKQSNDGLHF